MQPPPIPDENSNPIEVFQYCSYYVRQFFLLYVSPVRDWVYAVAILGCAAVFKWTFLHPQDPDQQYKIVNFLSAWFPFAISIIIALIPDLGTRVKKGWVWRLGGAGPPFCLAVFGVAHGGFGKGCWNCRLRLVVDQLRIQTGPAGQV